MLRRRRRRFLRASSSTRDWGQNREGLSIFLELSTRARMTSSFFSYLFLLTNNDDHDHASRRLPPPSADERAKSTSAAPRRICLSDLARKELLKPITITTTTKITHYPLFSFPPPPFHPPSLPRQSRSATAERSRAKALTAALSGRICVRAFLKRKSCFDKKMTTKCFFALFSFFSPKSF